MQLSTDAVVIREKKLAEHDRLLTLLTRDKGVITAYARGAGKLRGSLLASTEFLCYSHFQLFQNRDRTSVDRAESEAVFFGVRQDLEKLSLATYFCQLCCELVPELDCDEGYLRLLLNSLFQLERDKMPSRLLKPLFELRCLSMSGYMPDLVACCHCGNPPEGGVLFSPQLGVICCPGCRTQDIPDPIPLSPGVFQAMRHIIYSDFDRLFRFRLSDQGTAELGRVCESYLLAQVERMLPALHFYQPVCPPQKEQTPAKFEKEAPHGTG